MIVHPSYKRIVFTEERRNIEEVYAKYHLNQVIYLQANN